MNKQDLIMDFIDGKIDTYDKQILFEHLYYDETAREEFTQQIQILLKINQSFKPLPVPSTLTKNIYTALGIKSNYLLNLWQQIIQSRYTKFGLGLALLLLLTLSSFYIGQWYNQNKLSNHSTVNKISKNDYPIVSSMETNKNNNSNSNSNSNSHYNSNSTITPKLSHKITQQNNNYLLQLANYSMIINSIDYYYQNYYKKLITNTLKNNFQKNHEKSLAKDLDNVEPSSKNQSSLVNFNPLTNSTSNSFWSSILSSNNTSYVRKTPLLTTLSINEIIDSFYPKDYRYEITLSNIISKSSTLNRLNTGTINQFDLNALYYINSNNAIGLNIGYENFPQEFIRNIQGKQFIQIQLPYLTYLGISYRYTYLQAPYSRLITPYFNLMIGGTQVGPLIKGHIGANIPVWNSIAFNFGLQNSLLIYNVENTIYSTNKFNFVYGLNIKL